MDLKRAMEANARALAAAGLGTTGAVNSGPVGSNTGPAISGDVARMAGKKDRRGRAAAAAKSAYDEAEAAFTDEVAKGGEGNLPTESLPLERQSMDERRKNAADLTKERTGSAYEDE